MRGQVVHSRLQRLCLQIETDRLAHRRAAHRAAHAFEVAARVDGDLGRGPSCMTLIFRAVTRARHRCRRSTGGDGDGGTGNKIEAGGKAAAGQKRAHQAGRRRRAMAIMPARERPIFEQLAGEDT